MRDKSDSTRMISTLLMLCASCALPACQFGSEAEAPRAPTGVTAQRILNADAEPENWMAHGRTLSEQRFSPLDQINVENVGGLGLAWYVDLDTNRGQEATPIIVDGTMYVSTAWSMVKAFEAATGRELWAFDPKVPGEWAVNACCDVVNRGVAVWGELVFVGTLDGRLIALDAQTGREVWSVNTIDRNRPYTITGAPRVVKGKVLIGNGGAEFGVRGYVSAYDADTGALVWRFHTVPGNPEDGFETPAMEMAARTWSGEWWKLGGGGTVWDSMAYDADLDLLYVGTGNGSPWNHLLRSNGEGDNLFLSSIVALDPDDGSYVWHYQTSPGETWDHTATQHMILADLEMDGAKRRVLMQAPKNGFFYVLDAATGKLLSAEPFTEINWATHVDMDTGRPVETPEARYYRTGKPFYSLQGAQGAHNWHPMSFHPQAGLVYLPIHSELFPFEHVEKFTPVGPIGRNEGYVYHVPADPDERRALEARTLASATGALIAWDPERQKEVWRVDHAGPANGGTLATAGDLVFQGTGTGRFAAYEARTGAALWATDTQTGVLAAPVTYAVNGEQHVAIMVGRGGSWGVVAVPEFAKGNTLPNISRVLVYKLGGGKSLPAAPTVVEPSVVPPESVAPAEEIAEGARIYDTWCFTCHGLPHGPEQWGILPNLTNSALLGAADAWNEVVLNGALKQRGMASFRPVMNEEDSEAVRAYLIEAANEKAAAN